MSNCIICGELVKKSTRTGKYCSSKCAANDPEVKEKRKQTLLQRHNVVNVSQIKTVRDKIKQTCLEKYGVENPVQNQDVRDKIKQTCLEKYGVENPNQTQSIRDKITQTCLERFGSTTYLNSELKKQRDLLKTKERLDQYKDEFKKCGYQLLSTPETFVDAYKGVV